VSRELRAASILAISGALIPLVFSRRALAASASSTFRGGHPSAARRRCCQPCTGPLDHCVSLELSECGHDRKHGLSHRAVRVESLCDTTEAHSTLRQMFLELTNVNRVAPRPIQLPTLRARHRDGGDPGTDPVRVVATKSAGAMQYSAYTPMASAVATRSPKGRLSFDQHLSLARGGLRLLDVGQDLLDRRLQRLQRRT
jgi:hypothetical protein